MMHWLICSASWIMYACILSTQPGRDLVKVVNLETSGPGPTIPDIRLWLTSHSKQGLTLTAANPSHCCSLSNYPMQCCCEIRLKFVATRIISNSPIFQPHSSPLGHAHTHQQAANIWGYLLSVLFWRLLLVVSTSLHKQIGSRETL